MLSVGDDLDAVLGVLVGCGMAMVSVGSLGGCAMDWAVGRAMGRTMGHATAWVLVAVFALTSLGGIVTLAWSLFASQLSSPLFAECSKMV